MAALRGWVALAAAAMTVAGAAGAGAEPATGAGGGRSASSPAVATLGTPVFSLRRVPGALAATVADSRLATELDRIFSDPAIGGARDQSCLVVGENGAGGREVVRYSHRPDSSLIPASTMKVLTSAAALAKLGPDATFTTEVRASAAPSGGAVGDLFLVGGGDPLLSTAEFASDGGFLGQPRLSTSIEALADKVVAAGVRKVGRLLGDDSRYDAERLVPTWNPRYIANFDITPLSALVVNKGFSRTKPPAVALSPAAHAASVLAGLLKERGVAVGETGAGRAPAGAPLVSSIDSAPAAAVVAEILQNSDNMGAEMLVKELASAPGTPGSTAAGLAVVTARVADVAPAAVGAVAAVDGSGLDRSNRLSCNVLQRVLLRSPGTGALIEGLPTAGLNGTLIRRFVGTPAAGKVRAKTGSLEGVTGLAGFATAADGRRLTFALLANDLPSQSAGFGLQDRVASVLTSYPRAPSADELAPRPVVVAPGG